MSTPLICAARFADLRASILAHGTDGFTESGPFGVSCSMLNGEIFRTFGVDPFGRTAGKSADTKAARDSFSVSVTAAVFDWQRANWAAHVARYCEPRETWQGEGDEMPPKPSPKLPRGRVLSVPALLKALRALRYNCDGGNASGPTVCASLAVLDALIDSLKDHCLELLPEYRDAEWAI